MNARILIVTDVNGDGRSDLILKTSHFTNQTDIHLIYLANPDGTLREVQQFSVDQTPTAVSAADFDGDGRTNLAVVRSDTKDFVVLMGRGDGSSGAGRLRRSETTSTTSWRVISMATAGSTWP